MTAFWTCSRCHQPIDLAVDGEPHSDPATGDDVHDRCCASCHPHLADTYDIDLDATTDDIRNLAHVDLGGCGTTAGLARHRAAGEDPCDPCRAAGNTCRRGWRAKARGEA